MKTFIFRSALFIFFIPLCLKAQWTARQGLGINNSRAFATSFSLNGKIYVVGGQFNYNGLSDVWEYDLATDNWTQKASFPGGIRGGAVAFALGGKGYFMCGSNYAGQYFDDVWQYDPLNDTWTQKNNFPGGNREEAVGFTIGNKGYLGTGYEEVVGPNSTFSAAYSDFWEYDPASDAWTQKALIPGPQRGWAIGASSGGKGYIGLGSNSAQNVSYNDFYEYDPLLDTWTSKASYGLNLGDAMAFAIGQDIYVCGGIDFSNYAGSSVLKKFNPATNSWINLPPLTAGVTMGAVGVACNARGFVGTGYNSALSEKNDWWEFAVSSTLCPAPVNYMASTLAANSAAPCDGKIIISNITNGCAPYVVNISPPSGAVVTLNGAANNFTVIGLCAGSYTLSVTDDNCCGTATKIITIPQDNLTSFTYNSTDLLHLSVFPNPNEGKFIISGDKDFGINNKIEILNCLGQNVEFNLTDFSNGYEVRLADPQDGIYILVIMDNKGKRVSKKINVN